MQMTSRGMERGSSPRQVVLDQKHEEMLDHEMDAFTLRGRIHGNEDRAGALLVEQSAVESNQGNGLRSHLIGVSSGPDQIGRKAAAPMHRNQDQNILRGEQAAHLIDENVFANGV